MKKVILFILLLIPLSSKAVKLTCGELQHKAYLFSQSTFNDRQINPLELKYDLFQWKLADILMLADKFESCLFELKDRKLKIFKREKSQFDKYKNIYIKNITTIENNQVVRDAITENSNEIKKLITSLNLYYSNYNFEQHSKDRQLELEQLQVLLSSAHQLSQSIEAIESQSKMKADVFIGKSLMKELIKQLELREYVNFSLHEEAYKKFMNLNQFVNDSYPNLISELTIKEGNIDYQSSSSERYKQYGVEKKTKFTNAINEMQKIQIFTSKSTALRQKEKGIVNLKARESTKLLKDANFVYEKELNKLQGLEEVARQKAMLKQKNTEVYINNYQNSTIANKLNQLGYSDAMFSLGGLGNPLKSTYATIGCVSSLFNVVDVETQNGIVNVSFGDKGFFGLVPKLSMQLVLVSGFNLQYVIHDLINHEDPKVTTSVGKIIQLANLIDQCETANNISLAF
jgi:hypothetical protein